MAERRSLVAGVTAATPASATERDFVYKERPAAAAPATTKPPARSPLTTRIRDDYAKALKRASLERQLAGVTPNTLQDILEEALRPWLHDNGYLRD